MTKRFRYFLAVMMASFLILGIVFCTVLTEAVNNLQHHSSTFMNYNEDYLAQRLAEELVKAERKVFDSVSETIQTIDSETLEGRFLVAAIPGEYQEGTTAEIVAGDKSIPMQWKNGALEAEVIAPLDDLPQEYRITLKSGNTYRTEILPCGFEQIFGEMMYAFNTSNTNFDVTYAEPSLRLISVEVDETLLPFNKPAKSMRIYAEQNGKTVFEQPFEGNSFSAEAYLTPLEGQSVEIYAEVTAESGLIYRYFLWTLQKENDSFWWDASPESGCSLRIKNAEGKFVDLNVY